MRGRRSIDAPAPRKYDPRPTLPGGNPIYILGINSNIHDSAACLVKDGAVVMAVEEERLSREKHSKAFPRLATLACLKEAGIGIGELGHVAFCFDPWVGIPHIATHFFRNLPKSLQLLKDRVSGGYVDMFRMKSVLERSLELNGDPRTFRFHFVEHHIAHSASVFYVSPFDEAAILSIDGVGEWATIVEAKGQGTSIKKLKEIGFPHSLGLLYQAVTVHLGFRGNYDETKVMGLASYGDPERYRALFEDVLRLGPGGAVTVNRDYIAFDRQGHHRMLSDRFVEAAGPPRAFADPIDKRHEDLASALQKRLEEAGVHVARDLRERSGCRNLCLSGGVALNSVMNERIRLEAGFDDVFVQPACNDAGTAMGAALWIEHALLGGRRSYVMESPYIGPGYDEAEMRAALLEGGVASEEPPDLVERVARLIADGNVVGWFQGRSEWGPRALGNRSILADPRRKDMREILNVKVKHRETFRPFAPIVPLERCAEFFDCDKPSPYMLFVTRVKPDKREVIPAVTHVDGTARVQTVTRAVNPRMVDLLGAFERITGVPVLLNTSFNDRGEPIVCSPRDAIRTFKSTRIDALVLGSHLALKSAS
ncbi:MAG: carbamoyltransferase C-terminal domain-containing protein [Acidobacteriota bacterium]